LPGAARLSYMTSRLPGPVRRRYPRRDRPRAALRPARRP
jgi:hypothetical protein